MVDENKALTLECEIRDNSISKEVRQKRICGLLPLSFFILNYQESEIGSVEEDNDEFDSHNETSNSCSEDDCYDDDMEFSEDEMSNDGSLSSCSSDESLSYKFYDEEMPKELQVNTQINHRSKLEKGLLSKIQKSSKNVLVKFGSFLMEESSKEPIQKIGITTRGGKARILEYEKNTDLISKSDSERRISGLLLVLLILLNIILLFIITIVFSLDSDVTLQPIMKSKKSNSISNFLLSFTNESEVLLHSIRFLKNHSIHVIPTNSDHQLVKLPKFDYYHHYLFNGMLYFLYGRTATYVDGGY